MRELIYGLYEPILATSKDVPSARSTEPSQIGEGVIDDGTFRTIEVDRLFDAVNNSNTVVGQATLYRSLAQPLVSADFIKAKQEALQELDSDSSLRERIEELVHDASKHEEDFYQLLHGTFIGDMGASRNKMEIASYGHGSYKKGTKFMLDLVKNARNLPTPESVYLEALVGDVREFGSTRTHALMKGPVYRKGKGIVTKNEKGRNPLDIINPLVVKFTPTMFKPRFITYGGFVFLLNPFGMMTYPPIVGSFDRFTFIYPLRDGYRNSRDVQNTLDSLGKIDELLSFHRYAESFGSPTVLPEIVDSDKHYMILKGVRSPILGKGDPNYVPNDISLNGTRLNFITGPNSGGKTALCKTVAQVQLLSQIGCYVPAESAEIAVADRIFYQAPEINSLVEEEGRFGTELKRTRDAFLTTSPKSLVILDELSEGTTYEEKLKISYAVLNGFYRIGNNTILVTHNHELAEHFRRNGVGQHLQMEFIEDSPTYRVVDGISTVSHADRVARKIGFDQEAIESYLVERGYGR